MLARAGAALLAAAALLLVPSALAGGTPTLLSVEHDGQGHLTATWSLPRGTLAQEVVISQFPDVLSSGKLANPSFRNVDNALGSSQTSWTSTSTYDPGTYYLQIEAFDADSFRTVYSNVRSVTIPPPLQEPTPPTTPTTPTPGSTPAAEPTAARVARVLRGQVMLTHADGTREPVTKDTRFRAGDTITTGANALVELRLGGGGDLLRLAARSSFTFEEAAGGGFDLKKFVGKVWLRVSTTRSERRAGVITPNAAVPPRGTTFTVEADERLTRVRVYEHSVAVGNTRGEVQATVIVKAGYETVVRGSSPPTKPRRFVKPSKPFWQ